MSIYKRSSTLKGLSVGSASQIIEKLLRDRPLLKVTGDRNAIDYSRPHTFTNRIWSEEFESTTHFYIPGRVVKARDENGAFHTCWNNYWVYDLSNRSRYAASKVGAEACDDRSGTVDLVLGELERIDMELSLGVTSRLRELYGIDIGGLGKPIL